jgi:hypothetical protein
VLLDSVSAFDSLQWGDDPSPLCIDETFVSGEPDTEAEPRRVACCILRNHQTSATRLAVGARDLVLLQRYHTALVLVAPSSLRLQSEPWIPDASLRGHLTAGTIVENKGPVLAG